MLMNLTALEDKKSTFVFTLEGVSHGFCGLLVENLRNDKTVKFASYRVEHPLVGIPQVRVDAEDPKKAVKTALKAIKKDMEAFVKGL